MPQYIAVISGRISSYHLVFSASNATDALVEANKKTDLGEELLYVGVVTWRKGDGSNVVADHEPPLYIVRFYRRI